MMGRLVDIDEVIRIAENTFPQEDVRKIMWVLCHTPTAYDISKVVAELEEKQQKWKTKLSESDTNYMDNAILKQYISHYDIAIEIVRKGGMK